MGATAVGVHDPLDALEVGVVGRSLVHVDGDVARRAAVRGRQRDVVTGHRTDLYGEAELDAGLVHQASDPVEGLRHRRSEEHTSELQSLMRISYAVFSLKKKH